MSKVYPEYLGTISGNQTGTLAYWQELERKNEVEIVPSATEYIVKVFAPKNSKLMPWGERDE